MDSSGEEYNVLRVEEQGFRTFDPPAALPISESERSSSWESSWEDPSEYPDSGQPRDSSPLTVRGSFSLSPTNVGEGGSETSGDANPDEGQHLLGYRTMEGTAQSHFSCSEASIDSRDQGNFFAVCWQGTIARIYTLFDKVSGRFQST